MLITYCFEYAQTEKSKCTECNKVIKRHGLRIGELSRFSKKVKKSMATYRWWHFDCFKMVEKILEITPEKIRGYDKLSDVDKQRIGELAKLGVDATWYNVPENIRNELDKKAKQGVKANKETGKQQPKNAKKGNARNSNTNTNNNKAKAKNNNNKKDENSTAEAKPKPKAKIIKKAKTTGPTVGGLNENKINDAIRQLSKKLSNNQNNKKNNNKNNNNNKKGKVGGNAKGNKKTGAKANNNKSKSNATVSKNDDIMSKLKKKIQSKNTKITKKKN